MFAQTSLLSMLHKKMTASVIPVAKLTLTPSFPIVHVSKHQQPLGILHTSSPTSTNRRIQ